MYLVGVSYGSVIQKRENMAELPLWRAQITELPLSEQAPKLKHIADRYGCLSALHIPSYELIAKMPFVLDMRSRQQIGQYLQAVADILEKDRSWAYLVAHYPILTGCTDPETVQKWNTAYLVGLRRIGERYGVPVYLENVAVHPQIYLPECYEAAMQMCDGFCFDIGHAHTMAAILFRQERPEDYVADFFRLLKPYIRCVHLYNATGRLNGKHSCKKHYPFLDYGTDGGFMDISQIGQQILALPNLQYVIHEPHRDMLPADQRLDFGPFGGYQNPIPAAAGVTDGGKNHANRVGDGKL